MVMLDDIRILVEKSTDDEVRSLLFQMLAIMNYKKEAGVSEESILEALFESYRRFQTYKEEMRDASLREAECVHIVFGESSASSLSVALKELGSQDYVQAINDSFSYGPIWSLHEESGLINRKGWIEDHVNVEEEYVDQYLENRNETIHTLEAIPGHLPIYIWSGENALESQVRDTFCIY